MRGKYNKVWHHCGVHKIIQTQLVLEETCQIELYKFHYKI